MNKYRNYLQDNREHLSPRHYDRNTRNYSSLIKGAVGIGMGVLAFKVGRDTGLLGEGIAQFSKLKAPAIRGVAEGIQSWHGASTIKRGAIDAFKSRSLNPLRTSLSDSSSQLISRTKQSIARHTSISKTPLGGMPTFMDGVLRDADSLYKRLPSIEAHNIRSQQLFHAVRGRYGRERGSEIVGKLAQAGTGKGRYTRELRLSESITPNQMKSILGDDLLSRHSNREEFVSELINTVRTSMAQPVPQDVGVQARQVLAKDVQKIGQRETFLEKVMSKAGYSRATVGDTSGYTAGDIGSAVGSDAISRLKADPLLFKDSSGTLIDLRRANKATHGALGFIDRHLGTPIVNLNPLRLLNYRNIMHARNAPKIATIGLGELQPLLSGDKAPLEQIRILVGDSVYRVGEAQAEKTGMYMTSSKFGTPARLVPQMAGVGVEDIVRPDTPLGKIGKFLDVGRQDSPSIFGEWRDFLTKKDNPYWERNVLERLQTNKFDPEHIRREYSQIHGLLSRNLQGMQQESIDVLSQKLGRPIADLAGLSTKEINFRDETSFLALFKELGELGKPRGASRRLKEIAKMWDVYEAQPSSFLDSYRYVSNKSIFQGLQNTRLITEAQDVQSLMSRELIDRIKKSTGSVSKLLDGTTLSPQEIRVAKDLEMLTQFEDLGAKIGLGSDEVKAKAQEEFLRFVQGNDQLTQTVHRLTPWTQKFKNWDEYIDIPGRGFPTGQSNLLVNRHFGMLEAINESIKAEGLGGKVEPIGRYFSKIFTPGRQNLQDVTTGTLFPFHFVDRLNTGMASLGLGMSRDSMGSFAQYGMNMLGKRWLAALGGVAAFKYLNYEMRNITGTDAVGIGADILAAEQSVITGIRDVIGSTDRAKRRRQLYSGIEHLAEDSPIGIPLKTLGLTGDKSYSELQDYFESGYDPVRRGRWWRMGSKTPWYGDKVQYYEPSWYRRAHSEDAKAISLYGSEDEYWRNHWMPTPRFPLSSLRHFITDPYFLEKRNYWDRPYPETGSIPMIAETPFIGPFLDATVGSILKPKVKMHQQELKAINRGITQAGMAAGLERGAHAYIAPGGSITPSYLVGPGGQVDTHMSYADISIAAPGGGSASVAVKGQLTNINQQTIAMGLDRSRLPHGPGHTQFVPIRQSGAISALEDSMAVEDLMSMTDPRFRLGETFYSMTELAGIYGFLGGTFALGHVSDIYQGNEMLYRGPVTERARMNTLTRGWWDLQMGGLGMELSEIGRRFIPRERRVDYYNPIPNTMPGWLPGENYFLDFQTGDPYCLTGDTLVESGLQFLRADTISTSNVLVDSKGQNVAVTATNVRDIAPTKQITIATLPAFPTTASYDHPYLVRKLVKGRNRKARIQLFIHANKLLREIPNGGTRIEMSRRAGIHDGTATSAWKLLEEHSKIVLKRRGQRADILIIDDTPFDIEEVSKGLLFVQAKDLKIGDYVAYPRPSLTETLTKIDLASIKEWWKVTDEYVQTWHNNKWPRYIELTPELGFFAGLYCAEGNIGKHGGISTAHHTSEKDTVIKVYQAIGLNPAWTQRGENHGVARIGNKGIAEFLNWLCGGISREKKLNDAILDMPVEFIKSFIDGLFFGDGCEFTSHNRHRKSLKTSSWQLGLQVRKLLLALGIVAGAIYNKPQKSEINGQQINSGPSWDININGQEKSTQWFVDSQYFYFRISNIKEGPATETFGFSTQTGTFLAVGVATHNTQRYPSLLKSEQRLPGAGYEVYNELHPDEFGEYGAFDRFKILADVAPYSDEYRYWRDIATKTIEDPDLRSQMAEIKRQVSKRKQKYEFHPYRFKYADIDTESVTVTDIIDPNTFLTKEYPEHPIRLAGVRLREEEQESIEQYIQPGRKVTIGHAADELNKFSDDQLSTIRATVWSGDTNLNKMLIDGDVGRELDTDYSPAGVHARFSEWEMTKGKAWEKLSHMDTLFHTRFLQVRSPLETYERKEVFGSAFQRWWPPSEQLGPTYDSFISKGPIAATFLGTIIGSLFGMTKTGKITGAVAGGVLTGLGGMAVSAGQTLSRETWIPKRRRLERDIDEYFDILEYIKNKRLFEQANKLSQFYEGVDVSQLIAREKDKADERKGLKGRLEDDKDYIKSINQDLRTISEDRDIAELGPYSLQALQYHAKYTGTLYGADPYGSWQDIFRALPSKDRPFFPEFIKAAPEERERILDIVPENQRRIYQAKWGMDVDDRPELEDYFKDFHMPDANWAGWEPGVNLEDIKYKVVKNEALDVTEFGMWDDTKKRAEMLNIKPPNIFKPNKDISSIRGEINKVLKGHGIRDLIIEVSETTNSMGINVDVDISEDLMQRFRQRLREEPEILVR